MQARLSIWLALSLTLIAACSSTPPGLKLIEDAANALGGVEKVQAVNTLVLTGEGTQYNLGQDVRPDARGQTFGITGYRRAIDLAGGRSRTEQWRTPNFPYFQGPAPQQQLQGFDGIAWNGSPTGTATRASDAVAVERRGELYHHPLVAVRAALAPDAVLGRPRSEGGETLVDVTAAGGQRFTLAVNSATKLPTRVITTVDHTNLGDVPVSTTFEDYQLVDGLRLPAKLTLRVDTVATTEMRIASHGVGADTGDLAVPADAAAMPASNAPAAATVTAEVLGKGIWRLAGGSHHSVLVEFKDHAVLIEAPQNDTRTLAVIAKARELLPAKPLTKLVTTHHHFDHTGGVRAAIAEGLQVLTHNGNVSFVERIADRPHTINPDHLAKNPKEVNAEAIGPGLTLTDGTMTLQLFPVSGAHSETMLIAWLPTERLLVEADLYSPGGAVQPFAAKFLEDVRALKLDIARVVPLHGAVVPYAQFVREAAARPAGG